MIFYFRVDGCFYEYEHSTGWITEKYVAGCRSDDFKYDYFRRIERVVNAVRMTALKTLSIPHTLKKNGKDVTPTTLHRVIHETLSKTNISVQHGEKHNYSIVTKKGSCCYTRNVGFRWAAVGCRYVTAVMRLSVRCRDNAKRLLLPQTFEWGNDLKAPNKL